jgi:hypothetical protein
MEETTNINKEKYLRLKQTQQNAEKFNQIVFPFEGRIFNTSFTKYLLTYLEGIYN